jgi:signal peptidase I
MRRTIGLGVAGLALVALAALARRLARLEPVLVQGDSMRPTLRPGQRLAVGPLDRPPRRGDLVVVRRPAGARAWDPAHVGDATASAGGGMEVVKRVVGLPGERLRLAGGRLEVDGVEVAEPYLAGPQPAGPGRDLELRLGDGQYLVLGDHRAASTDGRDFGPVPAEALAARVRFAYWPPRRLSRPARARMRANVPVRRGRGR